MDAKRPVAKRIAAEFRKWLLIAFGIVFAIATITGGFVVNAVMLDDAKHDLNSELDTIEAMADMYGFIEEIAQSMGIDEGLASTIAEACISGIVMRYETWEGGVVALAVNGQVVTSNAPEVVGLDTYDLLAANPDEKRMRIESGDVVENARLGTIEGDFLVQTRSGTYRYGNMAVTYDLLAAFPTSEVHYYVLPFAGMIAAALAALLVVIYFVVMRLLNRTVVRNISMTNAALDEITAGNLEQKVAQTRVVEFNALSDGINTTVDALKESMADIQGRIDRELATAKAIQASALPNPVVPFPDIDAFDLYAMMDPAREVGGDFYDFFLLEGERVGIVMADVSGKGIPAALFMMAAKTEIRASMESGMGLVESLKTANYQLCHGNSAGMFVTVFAAVLDYRTGHMEYVNAGHNPPLLRHDGQWGWLSDRSGLFLGAYPKLKFKSFELRLEKDDELLMYTDGVTEAWDPNEELYGEERLEAFLAGHAGLHPHALIRDLRDELARWADGAEQADDITMLCLEYGVPPVSTDTIEVVARIDELDRIQAFIDEELFRRICPESARIKVGICLEELFVNVASYAYGPAGGRARVTYTYLMNPPGIRIEIADKGIPFDPLAKPDPDQPQSVDEMKIGGLGIFMTKQMADSISYEYRDGQNITTFELRW